MRNKSTFDFLKEIRAKAIAPYSKFRVGAVLVTKTGKQFTGQNIESSSYGLTICAERVALFKALSEGEDEFQQISILSDARDFCSPCGACRQVLMDFAPDIEVVLYNQRGERVVYPLKDLLPDAFTPERLNSVPQVK
ncbi:MAG: cytidine deaminase [bacterium]|nr:MAG: cytidine deaminase [bacterium]